jgi:hypothetical protein
MSLATILFIIVMLHLAVGFGYVVYKLEFSGKKKKQAVEDKEDDNNNED